MQLCQLREGRFRFTGLWSKRWKTSDVLSHLTWTMWPFVFWKWPVHNKQIKPLDEIQSLEKIEQEKYVTNSITHFSVSYLL